jgi:hypothetical protein
MNLEKYKHFAPILRWKWKWKKPSSTQVQRRRNEVKVVGLWFINKTIMWSFVLFFFFVHCFAFMLGNRIWLLGSWELGDYEWMNMEFIFFFAHVDFISDCNCLSLC